MTDSHDTSPFLRRIDWSAFWTATVVALIVYFITLAPSVTLEDSGELAVAADYLGVPHPPGYPIWTMICWAFTKVFAFVHFRGQPNPAWSVGLMSAVFGALTAGITAMLICRSGSDILSRSRQVSHNISDRSLKLISWTGGVVGSLLFAFTPIMWSQAVIVEVYSLNAFFLVIVLLLVYVWSNRPGNKLLYAIAFLFGLGLTNYQVLLLAALALGIIIMFKDFELFRDFAVGGGALIGVIIMLVLAEKVGLLAKATHPTSPIVVVGVGLNFLVLILTYFLLPRGRTVALTILLAELGLSFYVYMPIVSDLRNPPMNWGYPRTWEGFLHAIKRGQYEKIQPSDPLSLRFLSQLGVYLGDLTLNYALVISLIGFIPFITYNFKLAGRKVRCMEIASGLVLVSFLLKLVSSDSFPIYKMPAFLILLMVIFGAWVMIVGNFRHVIETHLTGRDAKLWERITSALVLLLVAAAFFALVSNNVKLTLAPYFNPKITVTEPMRQAISQQLTYTFLMVAAALSGTAFVYWLSRRDWFEITLDRDSQKWITATQIAFVTLSIGLIALANLKMDVQDTFIQRVKFISSHALFSFWIGYGIIFVLAMIDGLSPRNRTLSVCSSMLALCLIATPLWKNWHDERLIDLYGGAEQTGHDFGWQFGNYQLRGAAAIIEELSPDEEPLPNPTYPPAMGQDAIFFGGTDPGRFVPTYMIYSAQVRPDVFLITQNALADNTYMAVMRDLYGNDIWIPSQEDSGQAFRIYVDDINAGRRRPSAGIKVEGGRVQVSGVMGVMEINGILAREIFRYNNYRHDFFVEESYVIQWMYPHLTPHGLIMKINRDKQPRLSASTITDDMDFWDWYVQRLTQTEAFRRDIVARKSFSKLRSAIAGLYASRGLKANAEEAFREARELYPRSPEANFRLVDVYMRTRQFDRARQLMTEFKVLDPLNSRVDALLKQLDRTQSISQRIAELQRENKAGKMDANKALQLADLYRQINQMSEFYRLTDSILANTNLPPQVHLQVADLYRRANNQKKAIKALDQVSDRLPATTPAEAYLQIASVYGSVKHAKGMSRMLQRYLQLKPTDWRAWVDYATVSYQLKQDQAGLQALRSAVRHGGTEAQNMIRGNAFLNPRWEASRQAAPSSSPFLKYNN